MDRISRVKSLLDALHLPVFAMEHLLETADYCLKLAELRGENGELACIAGLLHDVMFYLSGSPLNHARRSADWAWEQLRELGCFDEEELKQIHGAIYLHSDKDIVHGPLEEILKDADILQKRQYGVRLQRLMLELEENM